MSLLGTIVALLKVISLRSEVERLNKIVRDNSRIQKIMRQHSSLFENKQKYINHSLDLRIIHNGENIQKVKQSLSSLKRDALLNDGLISEVKK